MSTPDLTRKVRQLDNDVQAVYEMLAGISATQQRQANRLEELGAAQVEQGAVLGEANAKLDLIIRLLEER
jgi:3-deoxy-D-manno-octulosonic-acid transferase